MNDGVYRMRFKTGTPTAESLKNVAASEFFFYCAYIPWLTLQILNASMFARYLQGARGAAVRLVALCLLTLSYLLQKGMRRRDLFALIIATLLIAPVYVNRVNIIIDNIMFILLSAKFNFRKTAKVSLVVLVAGLVSIVLCAKSGIIQNYILFNGLRKREYLGFLYALRAPQFYFAIVSLYLYITNGHVGVPTIIAMIAIGAAIFRATDSRALFIITLIAVIVCPFLARVDSDFPLIRIMAYPLVHIYALCAVLSLFACSAYAHSNNLMVFLDSPELLSGRISLAYESIRIYGIKLFGNYMEIVGSGLTSYGEEQIGKAYFYIDNMYIHLLVGYGVIFSVVFIVLQTKLCHNCYINSNWCTLALLSIIALHCLFDDLSLFIQYNPFLLLLSSSLNKKPIDTDVNEQEIICVV